MEQRKLNLLFGITASVGFIYLYRRQNKLRDNLVDAFDVVHAWIEADYQEDIDRDFADIVDRYDD